MKSIMQRKDGTCYLCAKLYGGDDWHYPVAEEHHVVFGYWGAGRELSEKYGLKVYLCRPHHRDSREAVHQNAEMKKLLCKDAQIAFNQHYPKLNFVEIFGTDYLEEEE